MITNAPRLALSLLVGFTWSAWGACGSRSAQPTGAAGSASAPSHPSDRGLSTPGSEPDAEGGTPESASSPACLELGQVMCQRTFDCTPDTAALFLGVETSAQCPAYAAALCAQLESGAGGAGPAGSAPSSHQFASCANAIQALDCSGWVAGDVPGSCESEHAGGT